MSLQEVGWRLWSTPGVRMCCVPLCAPYQDQNQSKYRAKVFQVPLCMFVYTLSGLAIFVCMPITIYCESNACFLLVAFRKGKRQEGRQWRDEGERLEEAQGAGVIHQTPAVYCRGVQSYPHTSPPPHTIYFKYIYIYIYIYIYMLWTFYHVLTYMEWCCTKARELFFFSHSNMCQPTPNDSVLRHTSISFSHTTMYQHTSNDSFAKACKIIIRAILSRSKTHQMMLYRKFPQKKIGKSCHRWL